jgi:hypothetical protein
MHSDNRAGVGGHAIPSRPGGRAEGVDAYVGADDKDDIGGVVGATVGFRLGHVPSFYVAADDYIHGTRIDATSLEADKQTQNDVQLSFGFGFPFGGR